ncbi:MAG: macro domain-containing protein [Calditrichaeota bacterium]|nr:MAG: macro domain-containing protein [Calditrichota bacterium]MBL1206731.1 macro domain-containing protein [Calditrichota bacterium]NOG46557.1 macro domain-containing protein [Calditrichota bacterium]
MSKSFYSGKITLLQGDITEQATDAIVNPANEFLQHGGGVAFAIVSKGGFEIQKESNKIGHTPVGTAVITSAGKLKAKHIIHAVGPKMGEGQEDEKLASATLNSLKLARENNLKSIAFPAISTGIFGYPIERCAPLMLKVCVDFLMENNLDLEIVFCLWTVKDYDQFENALKMKN